MIARSARPPAIRRRRLAAADAACACRRGPADPRGRHAARPECRFAAHDHGLACASLRFMTAGHSRLTGISSLVPGLLIGTGITAMMLTAPWPLASGAGRRDGAPAACRQRHAIEAPAACLV